MELTEYERKMVLADRLRRVQEQESLRMRRVVLDLAARYEAWLQDNGRGSTFSTFVNEFGYDEIGAAEIYRRVQKVQAAVD